MIIKLSLSGLINFFFDKKEKKKISICSKCSIIYPFNLIQSTISPNFKYKLWNINENCFFSNLVAHRRNANTVRWQTVCLGFFFCCISNSNCHSFVSIQYERQILLPHAINFLLEHKLHFVSSENLSNTFFCPI